MSWKITASYTPPYPSNPTNNQSWVDVNTGFTWVYNSGTQQWVKQ